MERLRTLHLLGFTHNDIKPDNVLIGLKDPTKIYLIDFGLSSTFKDPDGSHLQKNKTGRFTGNYVFASINACRGFSTSRRDDV
mgnify:CR=1 FL=1